MSAKLMLREFHNEVGHESIHLRFHLIVEEFAELHEELLRGDNLDRAKTAREMADLVYVLYGTADFLNIDLDKAVAEVHRANMDKVKANLRRKDGKLLKPEGWKPPNMEAAV